MTSLLLFAVISAALYATVKLVGVAAAVAGAIFP